MYDICFSLFSEELEFLKNIYFDELTCDPRSHDCGGCVLQFHVTPCTGDDKDKQYVYLIVTMTITEKVSCTYLYVFYHIGNGKTP